MNNSEREKAWNEFEHTGAILSYLKYKGISAEGITKDRTEDGEPFGNN